VVVFQRETTTVFHLARGNNLKLKLLFLLFHIPMLVLAL